jgi:hypothetical protein
MFSSEHGAISSGQVANQTATCPYGLILCVKSPSCTMSKGGCEQLMTRVSSLMPIFGWRFMRGRRLQAWTMGVDDT